MPHPSISIVYQGLGCQHSLLPNGDDYAAPSIPALTVKGFVRWQAIQTLLGPQTQVPVLQFIAANWDLKHPDTGTPLPSDLPSEAFPSETDPDTDRWHQECANQARMKAAEAEPDEPPTVPNPEFTDRKVPYSRVRVTSAAPRDYFTARPVNVAYVRVSSPRPPPPAGSPERERARDREHYVRRQASSLDEPGHRRPSFSDYPSLPHEPRPVRVTRIVSERSVRRDRSYSSTSDSDDSSVSPRTIRRAQRRADEPPPVSVRRVYAGNSEEPPRVIRTTMPPPPIPPPRVHSPRPPEGVRGPSRDDDSKRRSAFFDLKEKLSNFIQPGISTVGSDRPRSVSGSRGRRDGIGISARSSREDILPGSRLSRSWSDSDTEDSDSEDDRRRRSRKQSHGSRERLKERERERERGRERDMERERERDPCRLAPSPAASAVAAALHRDRLRAGSDEDLSPRNRARGPYLPDPADGNHRRTSSHADIDRWRDWERERERDLRDREEERWRRGRERARMPSPSISAVSGVTGVGGRKYPGIAWSRD